MTTRAYTAIRALRSGQVLDLDGLLLRAAPGEIAPGDLYVAERNSGPVLLTARSIDARGWILSRENGYPYDWSECVKVQEA